MVTTVELAKGSFDNWPDLDRCWFQSVANMVTDGCLTVFGRRFTLTTRTIRKSRAERPARVEPTLSVGPARRRKRLFRLDVRQYRGPLADGRDARAGL